MFYLKVQHAVNNQEIFLIIPKIAGLSKNTELGHTVIFCDGGSGFPVKESKEELVKEIKKFYSTKKMVKK